MDILTKAQRSERMSRIKSADTKIELKFKRYLKSKGINRRAKSKLTGHPDVYFPANKLAVFIDGCFWHKCKKCYVEPKSNKQYWTLKISKNVKRDKLVNKLLKQQDIRVLRFWEHEINTDIEACYKRLIELMK